MSGADAQRQAESAKAVGFVLAAAAVAVSVLVLGPRCMGVVAGTESELLARLKKAEAVGLEQPVGTLGMLRSSKASYDRVTVESLGGRWQILATLDFTGHFGQVQVSSLGVERPVYVRRGLAYEAPLGPAPRLAQAVLALERRRRALEQGDLSTLAALLVPDAGLGADTELERVLSLVSRRYEVTGWYLRFEREAAAVREEYHLVGASPDRPIDERGARTLRLVEGDQGFLFAQGLM